MLLQVQVPESIATDEQLHMVRHSALIIFVCKPKIKLIEDGRFCDTMQQSNMQLITLRFLNTVTHDV